MPMLFPLKYAQKLFISGKKVCPSWKPFFTYLDFLDLPHKKVWKHWLQVRGGGLICNSEFHHSSKSNMERTENHRSTWMETTQASAQKRAEMAAGGRRRTSADLFGPLCWEILLFKGAVSQRIKHSSNKEKLRLTKKTAVTLVVVICPNRSNCFAIFGFALEPIISFSLFSSFLKQPKNSFNRSRCRWNHHLLRTFSTFTIVE